ncbi:MAG: hypothetical protein FWB73_02265 [Treponema sp.]|nr:hypothetical protein [Treponema sp.]
MEIRINEHPLDVSIENEKTIGDVLAALDQWLYDSRHILSGLSIDGQKIPASQIEEAFLRDIDSVKCLDIETNSVADITTSSLVTLLDDIKEFESLDFKEKSKFLIDWTESAAGRFINSEMADLYKLCVSAFQGDVLIQTLRSIAEERLNEVNSPVEEFIKVESVLNEICEKLVDLPLDIQTGKDMKAAQTVQLFTAITEKIFRIFYQLDIQDFFNKEQIADNKNKIIGLINEFTDVLKELLDAYEKNDSVLVGDLAEYEASVKIKELYSVILQNCRGEK